MAFVRFKLAAFASLYCALSCADLPEIERLACGNRILEPEAGEACDTFASEQGDGGLPTRCGEPGKEGACLYLHDGAHDCPSGYGAGVDGVCRRPLGTFGAEVSRIEASGTVLRVADFDGDGVDDLMTTSPLAAEARVSLFSTGATLRESRTILTPETFFAPVVAELTAEPGPGQAADIVVSNPRGLAVHEGSPEGFRAKAYATAPFPEGTFPLAVPALASIASLDAVSGQDLFTNEIGYLADANGGVELRLLSGGATVARIDGASVADVAGLAKTDILPTALDLLFPYDDFVFGVRSQAGPDRIVFVRPQIDVAYRDAVARPLTLPDAPVGSKLSEGPFAWVLNDQHRVAVVTEAGAERTLLVYTNPNGPPTQTFTLVGADDKILAIASFVIFGFVEVFVFVTPTGIDIATPSCFTACNLEVSQLAPNPNVGAILGDGWTTAVLDPAANLFVAASSRAAGIDVYRIDADGGLAVLRVPTAAPVHRLARGDYDGDDVLDTFAISGDGEDACSSEQELLVLYGDDSGFPEATASLGELRGTKAISSGALKTQVFDGVDDIVVMTSCEGQSRLGVFEGAASRSLLSYFPLPGFGINGTNQAPVVPGRFGADAALDVGYFVVKALGPAPLAEVGVLDGSGDAQLSNGASLTVPYATEDDLYVAVSLGRLAAGDANGDGIDDLAMCAPQIAPAVFSVELSPGCRVFLGGGDGLIDAGGVVAAQRLETKSEVALRATLTADWMDVDDDGALDLVHGYQTGDDTSLVLVFRGDGAGGLSEIPVVLPEGERFAGITDAGHGIASGTVIVASATRVYACAPKDDSTAIDCGEVLVDLADAGAVVLGVATAELTGDGVTDLVVSTSGGTSIFPQLTWEP